MIRLTQSYCLVRKLLCVFVLSLVSSTITAQDTTGVLRIIYNGNWQKQYMPLGLMYLQDKSHALTLEKILEFPRNFAFKKANGNAPTFWAKGNPYWFKFRLKNATNINQTFVVELPTPLYDEGRFYAVEDNKILNVQYLSWDTPQLDRPVKHRNFIFPIALKANQEITCYLKLRKEVGSIWVPITVWERNAFDYYYYSADYHTWGFVIGILLFVVFFSFLLLFAFKDMLYFFYGVYVLMAIGFICTTQGYFIRFYVDGSFGVTGNRLRYVCSLLFLISGLLFIRKYLRWDLLKTSFFNYMTWILIGVLIFMLLFLYLDHLSLKDTLFQNNSSLISGILSVVFWFPTLYVIFGAIYCIVIQHFAKEAFYFLLANLPIATIVFHSALGNYEVINGTRLVEIEYFAGAFIIEIVVLMVLLAYRLKAMQDTAERLFLEKTQAQQQRTEAILEAEDRERVRIARDLHDGIGQMLAAARMALGNFLAKKKDENEHIQNSLDLLEESIKEIREISHNMMPGALTKLGLSTALKQFVNKINALGVLQIELQIIGIKERLNEKTETMLYRVVQEILSNIIRHSEASKVSIELVKHESELVLVVEDNGKGFDTKDAKNHGIGIKNVATRVEYLNGSVNFDSAIGRGTSVIVEIPLINAK
ncbi:7TM-DISM domain-containing protein [Emticicia sp. BO119]|uniref:sensor histidine kinase n=1 Tax=Emticicia sp. BO119 TaxID=2757768 RepID=UPI0015F1137B|nr:7TM-DISM domain-containing protein [Emticicia sp. BO119]